MIFTQGYAAFKANDLLQPYSFERRALKDADVLIDILYCGVCHSDIHQVKDEWGNGIFPMVPGHEIIGKVSDIGTAVTKFNIGDIVGVGCMIDACRQCDNCSEGFEQFCIKGMIATYNSINPVDNQPTLGGYADHIVVDEQFILTMPKNLPLDASAPLLCAGITLYSPLKHWHAGPGKKVAIIGLGGLGHIGVKIAHALGAKVSVLSHSPTKENDAKKLGADYFYSTDNPQIFQKLACSFDLIINTVSYQLDWNLYLNLLKRDGAMVVVGIPAQDVPIKAFNLIGGRRTLAGSLIGGIKETQEMLDFCGQHHITSDIEVIPIDYINQAYQRVLASDVHYRFVIDMHSLKHPSITW